MTFTYEMRQAYDPNWCMREEQFNIENNRHYESIFALGTGYMTTRASIEEGFKNDDQAKEYDRFPGNVTLEKIPESKNRYGTFMPVIQGHHPHWRIGIVNLPFYLGMSIEVDGETLDLECSQISDYCRQFDIKSATLYRSFVWHTKSDKDLDVCFMRFMNPEHRFACVQQCRVRSLKGNAFIRVTNFVDNNVRTNGFDKYSAHCVRSIGDDLLISDVETNMGNRIVTACKAILSKKCEAQIEIQQRRVSANYSFELEDGEEIQIEKISFVATDAYFERDELETISGGRVNSMLELGAEKLHAEHRLIWSKLWEISDVIIEADDADGYNSQQAIRMAIYHLLRSKAKDEDRGMICPKGLTSEVYLGSVFWDMEIFIQPFYIYTDPQMARTTHMFRFHTLAAAKKIARDYGYIGARYPWQSSSNGEEACPLWQYAEHQVHITSDVVIGLWHYFTATNDIDFLIHYGAEIILETARYWTKRVDKVPGRNGYQIYGVMGPDEYKPLSNNNAYTNYSAKFNLSLACYVIDMIKETAPEEYIRIKKKIDLGEEEYSNFSKIANGISIVVDEERSIIWQCDNFETAYADIDINSIWEDRTKLFGLYVQQEKRYRSKTLKQSDVTVLLSVFSNDFSFNQRRASFDYYEPYNIHDSSNSMCHHLITAAALGRKDTVYWAWMQSIDIDFGKRHRAKDGIHCANVGGMWQEVVFGFSGMSSALNSTIPSFNPCLPKEIKTISFKFHWKGNLLQVMLTPKLLLLTNLATQEIPFSVQGQEYLVKPGECTSVNILD